MPHRQRVPLTLATQAIPPICMRPDNTALLIQDMQYSLVDPAFGLGRVARERGIPMEFEPYYQQAERIIENIDRLRARMTDVGMLTIYTRLAQEVGERPSLLQRALGLTAPAGEQESQVVSALEPAVGDVILCRRGFDAFTGTRLREILGEMGIENLVLTGVITEFGIRSSAATAQDFGFHPLVLSDATASMTYETQSRTLGEICYGLTKVRSTGEMMVYLDEMMQGGVKVI